jgi:hypothetical protein
LPPTAADPGRFPARIGVTAQPAAEPVWLGDGNGPFTLKETDAFGFCCSGRSARTQENALLIRIAGKFYREF